MADRVAADALSAQPASHVLIIAHRGASGYLPEHTLPAKALAMGMGADYLEQDVVLTRDDQPIVLHDIHLDTVTDVAAVFPDRARDDGRFYAIDFTLAEVQQLRVHERIDLRTGRAVFPTRFPYPSRVDFRIPTLAEELELAQGLSASSGRVVGVYPEIKAPAWHQQEGKDLSQILLRVLDEHGYRDRQSPVFVQCFDPAETERLRNELGCRLRIIQLMGEDDPAGPPLYGPLTTANGLRHVATYADGIGPALQQVINWREGSPEVTELVRRAHEAGLVVHPYTVRADALPPFAREHDELLEWLVVRAGVDGFFTDFTDRAFAWRAVRFPAVR